MLYSGRRSLFNRSEAALFIALADRMPFGYHVFPKVRLVDFLQPATGSRVLLWRIWAKHVDFLLCDRGFKPVLAIELNGGSHRAYERIARDAFVARTYHEAGLPFLTVIVGEDFSRVATEVTEWIHTGRYPV